MPITKSAIKKQRSDEKKAGFNKATKTKTKSAIDAFKKALSVESLSKVFSMVDKAAKKGVLKKGKADRIKARLAKKISPKK
jgi:small subunit ribosomal protein S20